MGIINIDGLLEPVRTAPSEGEALKRLLMATEGALVAIKRMLGGVDNKAKVEAVIVEIDGLLSNMVLSSPKVEATMRDPRSKAPILPPPLDYPPGHPQHIAPEKHAEHAQPKAEQHAAAEHHAAAGSKK